MLLISKTYFILIQGIVLILFLLKGFKKGQEKYFLFSSEFNFYVLITGAIILGYLVNSNYQLFCIPVSWTKITLLIYSVFLVGNWFFKKVIGGFLNQLILGTGLFISFYIIGFGSLYYLTWSTIHLIVIIPIYYLSRNLNRKFQTHFFDSLNLFGITILLPYLVIAWTIWQLWNKRLLYKITLFFLPMAILLTGIILTVRMKGIIETIDNSTETAATTRLIIANKLDYYLTELILGAHWKYHTKICLYDGWRPPFHDPVLGFAQPFLYYREQFNHELSMPDRVALYKKTFPENKISFDCKCAKNERIYP